MTKKHLAITLAICMIFTLTSCNTANTPTTDTDFPVQIGHSTVEYKPERVVVLSDNIADVMIANEYVDVIIAKSDDCTQEEIKEVPSIGSSTKPTISEITTLSPDVVFANSDLDGDVYNKLINADVTVFKMLPADSDEELISLYQNVCSILIGKENGKEQGASTANKILNDIDEYTASLPKTNYTPTACYLVDLEDNIITDDMYQSEILSSAGAINVAIEFFDGGSIPYTIDNIVQTNPDYIFCDIGLKDEIMTGAKYKNMSAVKNKNVYEYDDKLMFRQGKTLEEDVISLSEIMYENIEGVTNELSPQDILTQYDITITEDINIQVGDSDDYVFAVQTRLQSLGYWGENDITGYYGEISEQAVQQFKSLNNLDTSQSGLNSEEFEVLFSQTAVPNNA